MAVKKVEVEEQCKEKARRVDDLTEAGITIYAKVPSIPANNRHFERYNVKPGTLLLLAPNGEKLASCSGSECSPQKLAKLMGKFEDRLAAWERKNGNGAIDVKHKQRSEDRAR